jgi:hypothetical protein
MSAASFLGSRIELAFSVLMQNIWTVCTPLLGASFLVRLQVLLGSSIDLLVDSTVVLPSKDHANRNISLTVSHNCSYDLRFGFNIPQGRAHWGGLTPGLASHVRHNDFICESTGGEVIRKKATWFYWGSMHSIPCLVVNPGLAKWKA